MSKKLPPVSSEPENYSIDEMMDRLKNSISESDDRGELVTRGDGSQAIKVRKRKRRSDQPNQKEAKQNLKLRIAQVSGFLILLFLTLLVVGVAFVYANSRPFRKQLVQNMEQASGATVGINQFRMNPKTANAVELTLKWPDGNLLNHFRLTGVSAEVFPSSFLGKAMTGGEVTINQGDLTLQIPKQGQAIRNRAAPSGLAPIRFDRYRFQKLNLTLGPPEAPVVKLMNSQGSLSYIDSGKQPQLNLSLGDLVIIGWPKLRLDRSLIVIRGDELNVVNLRMLYESDTRGTLEFSGNIAPYKPDQMSSLVATLDAFQISGIAGPVLGRLFSGRIDSLVNSKSNQLSFLSTANPSAKLEVAFQSNPSSPFELQGFPFLFALNQLLDDPWFERPNFDSDVSGVIHREGGSVSLRNLNLQSKGRLALMGSITLAQDQKLSGSFQVGVAEAMLGNSKNPRLRTMFNEQRDGFRWVTLKISGSASAPSDNFKELFATTAETTEDSLSSKKSGKSDFEELTKPK